LTRLQAFALDAHFSVEHVGRYSKGHFVNFNGTAGVWRRSCIEDTGGWEHDTLTEDLDLSFRAQLKGWKFKFLEDVVSPAELPVVMTALKNQQYRWNKGGAENFRKLGKSIWQHNKVPLKTRIHAVFQLLSSSVFLCVFITAVISIPVLFIKSMYIDYKFFFDLSSLFLISMVILIIFYWNSYRVQYKNKVKTLLSFTWDFVFFLSVAMGLSFYNSIAVIEGHLGKKSSFIRTPKFNIQSAGDNWKGKRYLESQISLITVIEGFLSLYFLFGVCSAFYLNEYALLPFHLMLFAGFSFNFMKTIRK